MVARGFVTQSVIEALRAHPPLKGCDCDAAASTESFDDDVSGCRAVVYAAFLPFLLRARPAMFLGACNMVMR